MKPRIFHGWGQVAQHTGQDDQIFFALRSRQAVERGGERLPAEIAIVSPLDGKTTSSQRLALELLEKACQNQNMEVRWFAYGTMRMENDGVYRMFVEHLDHVYLHRIRQI